MMSPGSKVISVSSAENKLIRELPGIKDKTGYDKKNSQGAKKIDYPSFPSGTLEALYANLKAFFTSLTSSAN